MMQAAHDLSDARLGKRDMLSDLPGDTTTPNGDHNGQNHNDEAVDIKEATQKLMKTFKVVDGVAPVDEYVVNRERYRVCQLFGKTYSKVLCKSSVEHNSNKFYIIQMLEDTSSSHYFVYFRWGRIGVRG